MSTLYHYLSQVLKVWILFFSLVLVYHCSDESPEQSDTNWSSYLGGDDRNHYSELDQINVDNVSELQVAWTYECPDSGQIQVNPLIIDGVLYGVTPSLQAFALNAATGEELWFFGDTLNHWASTSRGVSFWQKGEDRRILYTSGAKLWALNAESGTPIQEFGQGGHIDLHQGLPEIAQGKFIISNTPGAIYNDLIIMPVRVSEDIDAAPGDIRAFNIRTGKLEWIFHTIPYPGEYGYETFPQDAYQNRATGAANNWAGMAVDKKRGIIYVPTGSASYDFYGGNRPGQNLFSDCLIALDARNGNRIWHYQFTHHDIWDRDLPAPPNLLTIKHNDNLIDVVAQVTKQGYVFVFNRETGEPIYPIEETPVPSSKLEGETTWPTQPIPTLPLPFARQSNSLTIDDISPYADNKEEIAIALDTYDTDVYSPGSLEGSVLMPGYDGGAEWGGAAVDQEGVMYVNSNEMAWIHKMEKTHSAEQDQNLSSGEQLFRTYCQSCHRNDQSSVSNIPSIIDIKEKRSKSYISNIIKNGKGMMPGFPMLEQTEVQSIVAYLYNEEKKEVGIDLLSRNKTVLPYRSTGYHKFLDNNGLPAIAPPWGTLNAIDLNTGSYNWKIPLGYEPILKEKGIMDTGTENYGGPIVIGSGLLFIAATKDGTLRAIDTSNGSIIWESKLPAPSFATPSTYEVLGRQYIVLACGGTKLGTSKGNKYVAYALPQ